MYRLNYYWNCFPEYQKVSMDFYYKQDALEMCMIGMVTEKDFRPISIINLKNNKIIYNKEDFFKEYCKLDLPDIDTNNCNVL